MSEYFRRFGPLLGPSRSVIRIAIQLCLSTVMSHCALGAETVTNDSRPTITFVCEARPDQPNYNSVLNYLTAVFDLMGYRYVQKYEPLDKALELLERGEVDGDCARLDGFLDASQLKGYTSIDPAFTQVVFSRWFLQAPSKPRSEQRVGYSSNVIMLESYLRKMGYKHLFPIVERQEFVDRLRNGDLDIVVNYERAMTFLSVNDDFLDIKRSDSLITLPARPYVRTSLANEFGPRIRTVTNQVLNSSKVKKTPLKIPPKSENVVTFSCSLHAKAKTYTYLERRYTQLFHKLGYEYQQISMPRSRETHELSSGNIDGVCGRTLLHEVSQPNSIRVNTPIFETSIRAWSRLPSDEINRVEDFRPSSRVAYVRGTTHLENILASYSGTLVPTPDMITGAKMLAAGRVDYLLGFDSVYQNLVGSIVFQTPIYGVGKLQSIVVYPYLHESQKELAQKLEQLLMQ